MSSLFKKSDLTEASQLLLQSLEIDINSINEKPSELFLEQIMKEINILEEKKASKTFNKDDYSKIEELMKIVNKIELKSNK